MNVTTHFKSASSSSSRKTNTFNMRSKNCRMLQLLQTITETINTLFSVVNFLKCVATEVVSFSVVAFKTMTFHKVVQQHAWGVMASLVILLIQMFWFWQWKKFENRSIFDKVKSYYVKAYKSVPVFGATLYMSTIACSSSTMLEQAQLDALDSTRRTCRDAPSESWA